MNIALLQELSYQMTDGNPLWGLSLLNAHGDVPPAIRGALLRAFKERFADAMPPSPVALALINGVRTSELSTTQRRQLGSRAIKKTVPHPAPRSIPRTPRRASRQRLSTGSRYRRPPLKRPMHRHPSWIASPLKTSLQSLSLPTPRSDCK